MFAILLDILLYEADFARIVIAFCCILMYEADSDAILLRILLYDADFAPFLLLILLSEADSAAILLHILLYEADVAPMFVAFRCILLYEADSILLPFCILQNRGWPCTALRAQ